MATSRSWRAPVPDLIFLTIILSLAIYRVLVIEANQLELDLEEAYYLYWSREPAFGYFSKPPMIAWLLRAATELFGHSELAVKSVSLVLHTATALLVFGVGKRLYGPRIGFYAGIVFSTLPVIGGLSLYSTTDAPLHFFWALTLRLFLKARDARHPGWWLATGFAGGLGMLSKYTMGLLAVGLLLALFFSRQDRRWLGTGELWLGVLLAGLVWLPNLWWNAVNGFISFRHTAHIAQLHKELFHFDRLAEFWIGQILLFGPIFMLAVLVAIVQRPTWTDMRHCLLLLASLPLFALISAQALLAEANVNWASPMYVGLSLFVTAWLCERSRRWLALGIVLNLVLLSGAYHYHALANLIGFELSAQTTPYRSRMGWRALGDGVARWTRAYPDARLVSNKRRLLAYMTYYGADPDRPVASWKPGSKIRSQFDLQGDVSHFPNELLLFISPRPLEDKVLQRFDEVRPLGVVRVEVFADLILEAHGYLLSEFKGYHAGDPQDPQ